MKIFKILSVGGLLLLQSLTAKDIPASEEHQKDVTLAVANGRPSKILAENAVSLRKSIDKHLGTDELIWFLYKDQLNQVLIKIDSNDKCWIFFKEGESDLHQIREFKIDPESGKWIRKFVKSCIKLSNEPSVECEYSKETLFDAWLYLGDKENTIIAGPAFATTWNASCVKIFNAVINYNHTQSDPFKLSNNETKTAIDGNAVDFDFENSSILKRGQDYYIWKPQIESYKNHISFNIPMDRFQAPTSKNGNEH